MPMERKSPQPRGAAERLTNLAAEYWEFRLREHPYVAQEIGDTRYVCELYHESIDDYARRDGAHECFLERLRDLPIQGFAGSERFTWLLLERELRENREHFALEAHLRPTLFPHGPEAMIADALGKTTVTNQAEGEQVLDRLATIPAFFDDWTERLRAGVAAGYRLPEVLLPRVLAAAESYLRTPLEHSVWYKPFVSLSERNVPACAPLLDGARRLIEERVRPAYVRWHSLFEEEMRRHLRDTVATRADPQGEAYYALLARHHTTTALAPSEIHAIGLDEVARIRGEMSSVASRAGFDGDLAALRRHLATESSFVARSAAELRERIEVLCKRIERRIPEFFGRLPRMTYGVESIPVGLSAQLPPAYAQPNPAHGRVSGVYWITSLPERCPSYLYVPLALHEAWPGHLMHIALLQEMQELPAFRRYGLQRYTAFIEGWGLYCERLGHDMGFYADPFAHYGHLEMEMWRATRLVVDTGLHALGWSRTRAIAYMREHLTLSPETIAAEVDRYIGMAGQALAYKVGELKFRDLRRRAEAALGAKLDLRALHDHMLNAGAVTLDVLDEHVGHWIAASKVS